MCRCKKNRKSEYNQQAENFFQSFPEQLQEALTEMPIDKLVQKSGIH